MPNGTGVRRVEEILKGDVPPARTSPFYAAAMIVALEGSPPVDLAQAEKHVDATTPTADRATKR